MHLNSACIIALLLPHFIVGNKRLARDYLTRHRYLRATDNNADADFTKVCAL